MAIWWSKLLQLLRVDSVQTDETTQLKERAHACSGCEQHASLAKLSENEFMVLCLNKGCPAPISAEIQATEQEAIDAWNALFASAETLQRAQFTQTGSRFRFKKQ